MYNVQGSTSVIKHKQTNHTEKNYDEAYVFTLPDINDFFYVTPLNVPHQFKAARITTTIAGKPSTTFTQKQHKHMTLNYGFYIIFS